MKAKQLAHNALSGTDDEQILAEIFASIDDFNAKIEAGISNIAVQVQPLDVKVDDLKFDFSYEQVVILFLRREYEDFAALLREVEEALKNAATIGVADFEQFNKYRDMIRAVSDRYDVRNIAAVMAPDHADRPDSIKSKGAERRCKGAAVRC